MLAGAIRRTGQTVFSVGGFAHAIAATGAPEDPPGTIRGAGLAVLTFGADSVEAGPEVRLALVGASRRSVASTARGTGHEEGAIALLALVELPVAARLLEIGRADTIPAHGHATVGTAVPAPAEEPATRGGRCRKRDHLAIGVLFPTIRTAVDAVTRDRARPRPL